MTRPPAPEPGEPPRALIAALRRILSPLVRLLLAHGLTYPALSRLLKTIYVDTAERHFALDDRKPSDSRISLLTGVHRKDVRALRGAPRDTTPAPESVSRGSQLVALWLSERACLERDGTPRVLPRRATRGPSFDALATRVSRQDIKPRVLLDELVRLGVVEVLDGERVRLKVEAFVPQSGFDEKAFFLGRNVAAHLSAAASNLDGGAPPFFERAVVYHQLRQEDVDALRALSEKLGSQALKTVNARALSAKKRGAGTPEADQHLIFGVYFHGGPTDDDGEEDGQ